MKKRPLVIGPLCFEYPFVLAPLAGITDKAMRSLCSQAGASLTYTEMVSAKGLWYGDRKTGELLEIGSQEGPVGFQLFGSEPEILEYAVRLLSDPNRARTVDVEMAKRFVATGSEAKDTASAADADAKAGDAAMASGFAAVNRPPMGARTVKGLTPPALFDLNAGCPVPKIVRNGEGSALLKNPDLLYDCVSAMVCGAKEAAHLPGGQVATGVPIPVTVKIRKGFDRDDDCAVEIAKAAEAAGAAAITVHGRTRQQFYDGKADWNVIARVKDAVNIPVIGNGDICTGAAAIRMMEETGCDGVMIARGALGNPWIFRQARALWDGTEASADAAQSGSTTTSAMTAVAEDPEALLRITDPSDAQRISLLLHHIDLVCADKGEHIAVREMRKHVGWYIKGMRGAAQIRRQINTAGTVSEMKRILKELLQKC